MNRTVFLASTLLFFLLPPGFASAIVLISDTVWEGVVAVEEDIVVPEGITLTVRPGTVVRISAAESTKTDPEYLSPLTEITVRGRLKAEGKEGAGIRFISEEGKDSGWAGLLVDGGDAECTFCIIEHADTGLTVMKGTGRMKDSVLQKNRYGVAAYGESSEVILKHTAVTGNEYGIVAFFGGRVKDPGSTVSGNLKKDRYAAGAPKPVGKEYLHGSGEKTRIFRDDALPGTTVWKGSIEVRGVVRVPAGGRLVILPGTIVTFPKKDTNGDGIGENGLMIQGVIIAKGTEQHPIVFRSGEKERKAGDWDAINIMNSDGTQNLIEYCRIEDAYRALHFHFSNVVVNRSVLRNNFRGIQFQESVVRVTGSRVSENRNGLQARDSEILLQDNTISGNYTGVNILRARVEVRGNQILDNRREGIRLREGVPAVYENGISGNRFGMMVSGGLAGIYRGNVVTSNLETGISVKHSDNLEIAGNFISANSLTGMSLQDSRAEITGNRIDRNGERGIGIRSFGGTITGNNFSLNGLCAVDLESAGDVDAPRNWWGGGDPGRVICDGGDAPALGRVISSEALDSPVVYDWPLKEVLSDITWDGPVSVGRSFFVAPGATLKVLAGARVIFSPGSGMKVAGKIEALGREDLPVVFTSTAQSGPSDWDEILIEHGTDSAFSGCIFEYATWGIHSHFTNLMVSRSVFRKNFGGLRFRSGPAEVRDSLFKDNHIGVRSYRGNALITGNVFTGNDIGIFVREKGSGLMITGNNLSGNSGYAVRSGDFNDEDIDARNNYWGEDPLQAIFDGRREAGVGMVLFEPYAAGPFPLRK